MKIECTIDGRRLSFSLNSNKPLSLVLQENCDYTSVNAHCRGKNCGLCLVLLDNTPVLSCMVPAFEIHGKTITTFESSHLKKKLKDVSHKNDKTPTDFKLRRSFYFLYIAHINRCLPFFTQTSAIRQRQVCHTVRCTRVLRVPLPKRKT